MLRISNLSIVTVFVAVALLAMPSKSWAQLPEGVTVTVLAEYPVTVGGLKKVLFRKITLKPGASWSLTIPAQSFCQGTKGDLAVSNLPRPVTHRKSTMPSKTLARTTSRLTSIIACADIVCTAASSGHRSFYIQK